MSDTLKETLFGKTISLSLADGKTYLMREPDIESLENADFDTGNVSDIKNVKKLAWIMLKSDNGLSESQIGRLITASMLKENSEFLKAISYLMGNESDSKNEAGAAK